MRNRIGIEGSIFIDIHKIEYKIPTNTYQQGKYKLTNLDNKIKYTTNQI